MRLVLLLLVTLGCAPLPALVTDAQVRAVLPPVHHEAGLRCAERLNGHIRAAQAGQTTRSVVAVVAAAVGGTAFALRDDPAGPPLAVVAAAVGPLAEVIVRIVADPSVLLAAHGQGLASFNAARLDPDAGGELLERCVADQGPGRSALPHLGGRAP